MTGLGSNEVVAPAAILSAVSPESSMWSASLIYLMRCPGFLPRTLSFGTYQSHAHDPCDNRMARICFFGNDLFWIDEDHLNSGKSRTMGNSLSYEMFRG